MTQKKNTEKLQYWKLDKFVEYAGNPRKNDHAVDKIAAAINEFGFRIPIVAKSDGLVVDGHLRLKAAKKLGLDTVPVLLADDMTEQQIKAFRLSVNKMADLAEWDEELLALELSELAEFDFDMDLIGFTTEELQELIGGEDQQDGLAEEDSVPELPENPVAKKGDVWKLGDHRLMCGDSTNSENVAILMDDEKPNLMVTDPPYGVDYDANWRNEAERADGKPIGARAVGKVKNDDRADWSEAWELFPGNIAYVWHAGRHAKTVQESLEKCGFQIRNQIIWAKNNFAISRGDYHWKHKPCWYAVKNKGNWTGDRSQTTLWEIDKPLKSETGHSTQKPVECMRRPIINNSDKGDIVYDPFLGSGTTIIAAETEGRVCYGMELNPAYCDIILNRYLNYVGENGKVFLSTDDGNVSYEEVRKMRENKKK